MYVQYSHSTEQTRTTQKFRETPFVKELLQIMHLETIFRFKKDVFDVDLSMHQPEL